jgi:outer membrane protein OmpA-like peptidoglycan-associated protein
MFEDEFKEPTRWWIWFLVALAGLLTFLVIYSTKPFSNFSSNEGLLDIKDSTNYASRNDLTTPVNLTSGSVQFDEVTFSDIAVSGNSEKAMYTAVLFKPGEAALGSESRRKLMQIARSITRRFNNGPLTVYSYADSTGRKDANLELTRRRATQVRNWLIQQGGIPAANITVHGKGELDKVPRREPFSQSEFDRRIEIVAEVDRSGLTP